MSEPKYQQSNGHTCGACGDEIPVGEWYWQHPSGVCECDACHQVAYFMGYEARGEEG